MKPVMKFNIKKKKSLLSKTIFFLGLAVIFTSCKEEEHDNGMMPFSDDMKDTAQSMEDTTNMNNMKRMSGDTLRESSDLGEEVVADSTEQVGGAVQNAAESNGAMKKKEESEE